MNVLTSPVFIPIACSFVNGSLTVIVSIQIGNMDQLPTLEKSPVHLQFEVNPNDHDQDAESTVTCIAN